MSGWTLPALNAVMARHALPVTVTAARRFTSGFWNEVLHLTTQTGDLVFKHYRPAPPGSLFPNLPQAEALALQRLQGLNVAPDLVAFLRAEDILIYRYIPGPEWQDDMAAAAELMRRQSQADPSGFRPVPTDPAAILAEGDAILATCHGTLRQSLRACRPLPQAAPPAPLSLIHTDPAPANLVGTGAGLRLIDWQCPAAGDLAQDAATLLSPAFLTLYGRPLATPAQRARFLQTLNMPALAARLPLVEPAHHWRLACYCAQRSETARDPNLAARYAMAAQTAFHFG
jgi:hypothetical protein